MDFFCCISGIRKRFGPTSGYTLIEMILVVIIVGVIATIALNSLKAVNNTARFEETKRELEALAFAMTGDPNKISGGSRTDYGYVGDVGSLPANLNALVTNPGGFSTWRGPYLSDPFSVDGSSSQYLYDGWGSSYSYSSGLTIASNGGPSAVTRVLANSIDDMLYNSVSLVVTDIDNSPPGIAYRDSLRIVLRYPDGSGGMQSSIRYPRSDGFVEFDSIPIGVHDLNLIYLPLADTLSRKATVGIGKEYYAPISLAEDYFTGGP